VTPHYDIIRPAGSRQYGPLFVMYATDGQKQRLLTFPTGGGIINDCARGITLLKLTTDGYKSHKASRGLSATAELLVVLCQ